MLHCQLNVDEQNNGNQARSVSYRYIETLYWNDWIGKWKMFQCCLLINNTKLVNVEINSIWQ